MFHKQSLFHASIHFVALTIGYYLGYVLFEKASFGLLTAWWLSLYVGFIANIGIRSITPITIIYVAALTADVLLDRGWFYGEGSSTDPVAYVSISLAYGLVILISPIFVNTFVRRFLAKAT
jgi:hypothetical protein